MVRLNGGSPDSRLGGAAPEPVPLVGVQYEEPFGFKADGTTYSTAYDK